VRVNLDYYTIDLFFYIIKILEVLPWGKKGKLENLGFNNPLKKGILFRLMSIYINTII
jgi:hypothetical protein